MNASQTIHEGSLFTGLVTFTTFKIESERAREIDRLLSEAIGMGSEMYEALIAELKSICKTKEVVRKNLVVQTGRYVFSRLLIGDATYSGAVNYGALGTSTTAVAASQTQLVAEVKRKLFARRTRSNHQATFDFYYSKADTDGTYEEFGVFIDGTSTANSGQMFNRVLTGGWTKTDQEAMTVSIVFSVNES